MRKPKHWRTGQTFFNFLEWLRINKDILPMQSHRMADPFHIPDDKWDKWYKEFLNENEKV